MTGRITAKDSRQTTVMSKMMWRWKDKYVTASMPHLLRISSSLRKQREALMLLLPYGEGEPCSFWVLLFLAFTAAPADD